MLLDPFAPPFFDFLLGFSWASTCSSIFASGLRLVVLTRGRLTKMFIDGFLQFFVTARNLALFVWRALISVAWWFWGFFSLAVSLGLRIWCGRRRSSSSSLTTVQVPWLELHEFPFERCPRVSHWKTLSHFTLYAGSLSFLSLGDCSYLHNFVPDSEVSSSDHLINMKFDRRFQS